MIQMIHALLNNRNVNDGPFSIQMASNVDNSDEEGPLYMLILLHVGFYSAQPHTLLRRIQCYIV